MNTGRIGLSNTLLCVPVVAAVAFVSTAATAGPGDIVPCKPKAVGSYVHMSKTGDAASGHGWWEEGTCSVPYGTVTVSLQEYVGGKWKSVGKVGSASVRPGSSHQVAARAACNTLATTTWRSHVSVSVSGEEYGSDTTTTSDQSVDCRN